MIDHHIPGEDDPHGRMVRDVSDAVRTFLSMGQDRDRVTQGFRDLVVLCHDEGSFVAGYGLLLFIAAMCGNAEGGIEAIRSLTKVVNRHAEPFDPRSN